MVEVTMKNKPGKWMWMPAACVTGLLLSSCSTLEVPDTVGESFGPVGTASSSVARGDPSQAPVVLMLIDEKNLGTIPTAEVEAIGADLLIKHRCRTVDQDMLRASIEQRKQMLKMVGDDQGAAALGLQFGANVVLVGSAVCKPGARRIADTNLRPYQAVVTLRAIRTDNASVLASASETGSAMDVEDVRGGSKALRGAGKACFEKLIPATLSAWKSGGGATAPGSKMHPLELTFGGVEQLWKVKAIREALRGMEGVESVVQRTYNAGAVVFEANSRKPTEELAEDLVLHPPEGLKFQVLSIEAGKIVLRVTPS
jgi:hypothetical protein